MMALTVLAVLSFVVIVALGQKELAAGPSSAHNLRGLAATNHCADFKRIKLQNAIRSNLGEKGPDTGPEGIVYAASDYESPQSNPVRLHVNVEDKDADGNYLYVPAYPGDNGMYGLFGDVNVRGGNEVTLVFTATDLNDAPVTITEFDITFFDIDIGNNNDVNTTEAITIYPGWTAVHISSETQLQTSEGADGSVTYKASMFGRPRDSPKDPEVLDAWQFNKAVTVRYDNFQSARITLHAYGPGTSGRYFNFVLEPTILCVDAGVTANTVHSVATTVAPATDDKCCLLMLGPLEVVCTDRPSRQFYHFMCTKSDADEAQIDPEPSELSNNFTNSSECCIANSGPVVVGCVPKEKAKFYHIQCSSSSASRQSMVEIANSCVLLLIIINIIGMFV